MVGSGDAGSGGSGPRESGSGLSGSGRVTADAAGSNRHQRGWPNQRRLLAYLIGGLLVAAIPVVASRFVEQPEGTTYTIDIPLGTAERLAAGENVEIIPEELSFKLRDVLVIVNRDSAVHTIGPFEVGPGERSEHSFGQVAAFSSYCSLHPSGAISFSISDD